MEKPLTPLFIAFISLLLASCASPEKDWHLAERDDSKNAYLEFLAKHPDSEFAGDARSRIDALKIINAWERAEFKDSLTAYQAFITSTAITNTSQPPMNAYGAFNAMSTGKCSRLMAAKRPSRLSLCSTRMHRNLPKLSYCSQK